jgi:hypothetical protein
MRKIALVLLVFALIAGFTAAKSEAGQICWGMDVFADIIKVSVTPTGSGHKIVNGVWFAGSYLNPVTGTFEKDFDGTSRRLSLHATNNTTSFGGFRDCILDADLSAVSVPKWEGPGIVDCGAGAFPVSGFNLIRVNCTTLLPLNASATSNASGKALGE